MKSISNVPEVKSHGQLILRFTAVTTIVLTALLFLYWKKNNLVHKQQEILAVVQLIAELEQGVDRIALGLQDATHVINTTEKKLLIQSLKTEIVKIKASLLKIDSKGFFLKNDLELSQKFSSFLSESTLLAERIANSKSTLMLPLTTLVRDKLTAITIALDTMRRQAAIHASEVAQELQGIQTLFLGFILLHFFGASIYLIIPTKGFFKSKKTEQDVLVNDLKNRNAELASFQENLGLQKRILQSILSSVGEAVVVFNSDGTLMNQNPAAINLFSAAVVGTHFTAWNDIIGLFDPETSLPLKLEQTPIALALEGKKLEGKLMVIKKTQTSESLYVTVTGEPLIDEKGRHQGAVISFHDVTEQVQSELELRRAKSASEAANQSKSEFLANISHEIRTPMTAILGYSDMLLMPTLTSEQRLKNVQIIRRNSRMLMQLIEDLLDISKMEAGRTDIEKSLISLQEIVCEVYSLLHCRAKEQNISFTVKFEGGLPQSIFTAPVRLRQILINIIGNAIKFTDTGEVKLTIRYLNNEAAGNGLLEFNVTDTGCGIPSDAKDKLFSPFVQVDTTSTRRYGGSGLGLALARRLSRALGGDLHLETSNIGIGSTFVATIDPGPITTSELVNNLTLKDVLSVSAVSGMMPSNSLEGIKILIVEDSEENRELFSCYLTAAGAKVITANDGEQAIDKALSENFDVILMDIQMPRMDGYQAVAHLREKNINTPIIALTAHAMEDQKKRSLEMGFNDYLTKPIEPSLLVKTVLKVALAANLNFENIKSQQSLQILDKEKISQASPKVKSILARFVQNIPSEIDDMKLAAEANDWEKLMKLAHKFQGTAGNCGFPGLMDKASQLQKVVSAEIQEDLLMTELSRLETLGKLSAMEFERLLPQES